MDNSRYGNKRFGGRSRQPAIGWREQQEREKNEEQQRLEEIRLKNIEKTEENFPSTLMGTGYNPVSSWGGSGKSFASLASEWEEENKRKEMIQRIQEKEEDRTNFVIPKFHNIRKFTDEEQLPHTIVEELPQEDPDGWTRVVPLKEKMAKKLEQKQNQTIEEKYADEDDKKDNSVWNDEGPQEYETCWDDKKY
jgi:hypothetical protein